MRPLLGTVDRGKKQEADKEEATVPEQYRRMDGLFSQVKRRAEIATATR